MDNPSLRNGASEKSTSIMAQEARILATELHAMARRADLIATKLEDLAAPSVTMPSPDSESARKTIGLPFEIQTMIIHQSLDDNYPITYSDSGEESALLSHEGQVTVRRFITRARIFSRVSRDWRREVERFFTPKLEYIRANIAQRTKHAQIKMNVVLVMEAQKRWFAGGWPGDEEGRKSIATYYMNAEAFQTDAVRLKELVDARLGIAKLVMY